MIDPPGGRWFTLSEFEAAFWSEADRIRTSDPKLKSHGSFFPIRNPSRSSQFPGKKQFDEWLPLLMVLKHETGRFENWDKTLLVSPSFGPDRLTPSGKSYDACVRLVANQPDFSADQMAWIEIVRAVSAQRSHAQMHEDAALSLGHPPVLHSQDVTEELSLHLQDIEAAIRRKIAKPYPDPTVLVVWVPNATSAWLNDALVRAPLAALVPADGSIRRICVVGESTGCQWVVGRGLWDDEG